MNKFEAWGDLEHWVHCLHADPRAALRHGKHVHHLDSVVVHKLAQHQPHHLHRHAGAAWSRGRQGGRAGERERQDGGREGETGRASKRERERARGVRGGSASVFLLEYKRRTHAHGKARGLRAVRRGVARRSVRAAPRHKPRIGYMRTKLERAPRTRSAPRTKKTRWDDDGRAQKAVESFFGWLSKISREVRSCTAVLGERREGEGVAKRARVDYVAWCVAARSARAGLYLKNGSLPKRLKHQQDQRRVQRSFLPCVPTLHALGAIPSPSRVRTKALRVSPQASWNEGRCRQGQGEGTAVVFDWVRGAR